MAIQVAAFAAWSVVEIDHRIKTVAIIIALHHSMSRASPVIQNGAASSALSGLAFFHSASAAVARVLTAAGVHLHMFGGIDAEAIDAVVTYPLAQPVCQIVARRIARDRFRCGVWFMAIEVRQA